MKRDANIPMERILHDLQERAKELTCLYRIDEILSHADGLDDSLHAVVQALPSGFQRPGSCRARIVLDGQVHEPEGFEPTPFALTVPIVIQGEKEGVVEVYCGDPPDEGEEGPFLKEERKLLETVADRIGHALARMRVSREKTIHGRGSQGFWIVLDFLRQTDRALLSRLGRKMINHLYWSGVEEAGALLRQAAPDGGGEDNGEENRPKPRAHGSPGTVVAEEVFRIAAERLPEEEVLRSIQSWIKEDRSSFLKNALERLDTPLFELVDDLERFCHGGVEESDLSVATQMGLRAALVRRFLTDQLEFVNTAKDWLQVRDFHELAQRIVHPPRSHGRIGGKSAGLFLASRIVSRSQEYAALLGEIKVPRSWYLPSDGVLDFIHHNDLDDVFGRKYAPAERIRDEYPFTIQLFKSSFFSPETIRGLGVVLDDIDERPLIVRSSSLLEDRLGSAFSGKYKSLFLPNTGTKRERLDALTDAIAEVYASVFDPDPIEYRARRGLLDLHEEMGVLIQEVVGTRVGPYYFPVFAGVGFSHNEFRWSPRIRREDGLLRLVPGLGTRAVDRLSDDYPVLVAPGQPGLRVNQGAVETFRYSPKKMDVMNVLRGSFETVEIEAFFQQYGEGLPWLRRMVSVASGDRLTRPGALLDLTKEPVAVTFEGLLSETPFLARMKALLQVLSDKLRTPVDIEFASDGEDLYLLQCRPQGATGGATPAHIPRDVARERIVFTAHRHISNGQVEDVTHVVYVPPEAYVQLDVHTMREVGRAVGKLNRTLPKRRFILVGPGRWGSRGDIRLGVPVTYADISNCSVLVEVARRRGGYVPDLSFGTHFFQDLVESAIRYLPLYPDDPNVTFSEPFFSGGPNALAELCPEAAHLSHTLRVIDVPRTHSGLVLRVLMNADIEEALGVLVEPHRPV
jgi:pyruvate,water dikinase